MVVFGLEVLDLWVDPADVGAAPETYDAGINLLPLRVGPGEIESGYLLVRQRA